MDKLQQMASSAIGIAGSRGEISGSMAEDDDQFPIGLRVLVVDDDVTCLAVLRRMLLKCRYQVTTCSHATKALSLLRESRGDFHVVLSDVHMPDMDGFRLLELVGLEMDLPVIMMSADERFSIVMKGIKHGACDYLIKPVRLEELKNIWQHVVRKKWKENKHELSGSLDDSDHAKRAADDAEYMSSAKEGADGSWRNQKKKRNAKEDDESEMESTDPASSKKLRVVWSVELHQQFVNAVNQLGIEHAVPKRILELMNVPGLTRENVASHLQKYRLYLRRLSGVVPHGVTNPFCNPNPNMRPRPLGGLDFRALAASGKITPQTLAALHDELLDQPSSSYAIQALPPSSVHALVQGAKCVATRQDIMFGHPLPDFQGNVPLPQFSQTGRSSSELAPIPNWANPNSRGSNLPQVIQQQQMNSPVLGSRSSLNAQPSCVVLPSQSVGFQAGGNAVLKNQPDLITQDDLLVVPGPSTTLRPANTLSSPSLAHQRISQPFNNVEAETSLPLMQSNNVRFGVGEIVNERISNSTSSSEQLFAIPGMCTPPNSADIDAGTSWVAPCMSGNAGHSSAAPRPHGNSSYTDHLPRQVYGVGAGYNVGRASSFPSRFAADDVESPANLLSEGGGIFKQDTFGLNGLL